MAQYAPTRKSALLGVHSREEGHRDSATPHKKITHISHAIESQGLIFGPISLDIDTWAQIP